MDERLLKIAVGFALQSAITNKCRVETILSLYSRPNLERAKKLHDELIESRSHCDREVAIWLEPMLDLGPFKSDPKDLEGEMKEMEFLLYLLINRVGQAKNEVNDWVNYIANAAESLEGGFWIDAKVLLSRALEISQSANVESLKSDPSLNYELDILQRATASYFKEIRTYPLKLSIPEGRLETILRVQKILLDLMQIQGLERTEEDYEAVRGAVRRLDTAVRYLMNESKTSDAAEQEVKLASAHLGERKNSIVNEERRRLIHKSNEEMKELIRTRIF